MNTLLPKDLDELNKINGRIDQTAAIAQLLAFGNDLDALTADALFGIGETLTEIAARMDRVLNLQQVRS